MTMPFDDWPGGLDMFESSEPSSVIGPIEHPHANRALFLGIVGILFCGLCSPIAWALGLNAIQEIDSAQGHYSGFPQARTGMILGIVGTCLMVTWALLAFLVMLRG